MARLTKHSKLLLQAMIFKRCDYILSKEDLSEVDLYVTVKEFFKELLQLHKEMTCQEIQDEINKSYLTQSLRRRANEFLNRLSEVEYKTNTLKKEEMKQMIRQFKSLITEIVTGVPDKPHRRWHHKIKQLFSKDDVLMEEYEQLRMNEADGTELIQQQIEDLKSNSNRMFKEARKRETMMTALIDEVENHLEANDAVMAQTKYADLKKEYDGLEKEQQKQFYDEVSRLYEAVLSIKKSKQ